MPTPTLCIVGVGHISLLSSTSIVARVKRATTNALISACAKCLRGRQVKSRPLLFGDEEMLTFLRTWRHRHRKASNGSAPGFHSLYTSCDHRRTDLKRSRTAFREYLRPDGSYVYCRRARR